MKISSLPHGCVGIGNERPLHALQWFELAARRDLEGVEVVDTWVMADSMEGRALPLMAAIQRRLSDLPLEVSAFINHGPYVWRAPEKNAFELDKAKFFMDWAADLGTKIFRVTTGVLDKQASIPDRKATEVFCGMIEQLLPYARARGLVIGLEEHPGFAGTVAKMEKILERLPDPCFGIAFDTKNTLREGENPLVILEKKNVLDRVLYTHMDNFRKTDSGWDRSVTLQEGEVDLRRIVRGLKHNGYDGWLSVEYGGNDLEHVFQSAQWLRSIWNE